jgi:uncharacterized protein
VTLGRLGRLFVVPVLQLFLLVSVASGQDVPIPPSPTQYVTDTVGFLSAADVDRLDTRLRDYEQQTQHQVIVYIGSTTGDVPIEDWANVAFERWGVGRKGLDDGLALFIMAKDRRLRIEVGYGLEKDIGDLRASQVIQEVITPRLRSGDNAGAVEAGIEALIQRIESPQQPAGPTRDDGGSRPGGVPIFVMIALVIVLGLFVTSPGFAAWILLSVLSGGNRRRGRRGGPWGGGFGGGWGGGGGGFSGGGGMSGGGGASGSW